MAGKLKKKEKKTVILNHHKHQKGREQATIALQDKLSAKAANTGKGGQHHFLLTLNLLFFNNVLVFSLTLLL